MFGWFKSPEEKQAEFEETINASRGWGRNFHHNWAEHKVLRIGITRLHGEGPPVYNNWKLEIHHFERPRKILFLAKSNEYGRNIAKALAEAHHYCWRNYMYWREVNGYETYPAPKPEQSFYIVAV